MLDSTKALQVEDLPHADLLKLLTDLLHRLIIHYGLWFTEVRHQMGTERALALLDGVFERNLKIQMARLGETFGFDVVDGLPAALSKLDKPALLKVIEAVAKNWLVSDGVWFQAVEFSSNLLEAKRCNDSCWAHFSPFEAWSIKRLLGLGEAPGLQGLAQALNFRLYARLNTQTAVFEDDRTLVFQMNQCRVQTARRRQGLADYPCKSAGLVEYTYFARSIDPRIATECIGCPPDSHPEEWFCAWRFRLVETA